MIDLWFALDKLVKNQLFIGGMLILVSRQAIPSLAKVIEVLKPSDGRALEDTSELHA
jgi:hypothetical protein